MNRWCKKMIFFTLPVLLSFALIVHFTLIILQVMPLNPLSLSLGNAVKSYTTPLFKQNWHLFAPNPISSNRLIYIKLRTKTKQESGWIDITTPLIQAKFTHYVTPMNKISHIPSKIFSQMYQSNERSVKLKLKSRNQEKSRVHMAIDQVQDMKGERTKELIYRFAFAAATKILPPQQIDAINIRLVNEKAVPYAERNNPHASTERKYHELGWRPYTAVKAW
jgi:hypothetical protein